MPRLFGQRILSLCTSIFSLSLEAQTSLDCFATVGLNGLSYRVAIHGDSLAMTVQTNDGATYRGLATYTHLAQRGIERFYLPVHSSLSLTVLRDATSLAAMRFCTQPQECVVCYPTAAEPSDVEVILNDF